MTNPPIFNCNNCINSNIYDVANAAAIAAAKYLSPPPPTLHWKTF